MPTKAPQHTPERRRILEIACEVIDRKGHCASADIEERTGLARQTVHRHLKALLKHGHLKVSARRGNAALHIKGDRPPPEAPLEAELARLRADLASKDEEIRRLKALLAARAEASSAATSRSEAPEAVRKHLCPRCGQKVSWPESAAGRLAQCPRCGQKIRLPG